MGKKVITPSTAVQLLRLLAIETQEKEARIKTQLRTISQLENQLMRANRIIGWMMPYIGTMCPPDGGLYDLNMHCYENHVPAPGEETKGPPLKQPSNLPEKK